MLNDSHFCPLCNSLSTQEFSKVSIQKEKEQRVYYQCIQCDLIFLLPKYLLSSQEEKKRYDLHQNSSNDLEYRKFLSRLINPLLIKIDASMVGLDYGCGPGPTISEMLKEKGFEVFNYDPFYFDKKDYLDRQYDFITVTEVLEHLHYPREQLKRLKNMLKPKGVLGVMTLLYNEDIDFTKWWYPKDPTHVCFYQKSTFQWIANQFGWKLEMPHANVALFEA